jgi:hypothetical protein
MSNPIFYAADMSSAVFTASLSANASYPVSNLNTNIPTLYWQSSASTNSQTLNIDLGSAKSCNFLAIGSHNFAGMTIVNFQIDNADNPAFPNPTTIIPVNNDFALSPYLNNSFNGNYTKRYWRLIFTNTNSIIPQCGLILLGTFLTMPYPYNMDAELNNKQFVTTTKETLSGIIRTSRQMAGRKRMEVTFTLIDDATVTSYQTMMNAIQGSLNPFFFADHLGTLHIVHLEDDYIPAQGLRANVNDIVRMKMRHQMVG